MKDAIKRGGQREAIKKETAGGTMLTLFPEYLGMRAFKKVSLQKMFIIWGEILKYSLWDDPFLIKIFILCLQDFPTHH